jgi:hypothetical protein
MSLTDSIIYYAYIGWFIVNLAGLLLLFRKIILWFMNIFGELKGISNGDT